MAAKRKSTNKKAFASKPVAKRQLRPTDPESSPEVSDNEIRLESDSESEEKDYSEEEQEEEEEDEEKQDDKEGDEDEFTGFGSDHDNDDDLSEGADDYAAKTTRDIGLSKEVESEIKSKIAKIKKFSAESYEDTESSTKSKKKGKSSDDGDKAGVLYIGRIPHGFYESQMRGYFSQFGDILRLRLSRNKKTGASKHYAFIEFASNEVAQIVADTMNNYLLYGHILKVSVVPENQVHEKMFVGSNRKFKRIPRAKLAKHQHDKKRNNKELERLVARENKRRKSKQEKLNDLGIDYTIPTPEVKSN
ncbi:uncharacterized protein V1513DRAFT_449453 [Lipomyces chichibuensis]|uniref:uncharacterized protein n=1 Tax=Lipomyces chichibuensis TaxID=1546026 RepID=UPI003343E3DF